MESGNDLSLICKNLLCWLLLLLMPNCGNPEDQTDRYGGFSQVQGEATGYFRTEKIGNRWVLITPEGHPYLALGANHSGKFLQDTNQSAGYLARFGGSLEHARQHMAALYQELGLNAGEAYAPHDPYLKQQLPYIAHIPYSTRSHFERDIFHPVVRDSIFQYTLAESRKLAQDSLVIGIAFKDLPIWDSRRVDYYRHLPATAPGKQAYANFLRERYQEKLDSLNATYGKQFGSFADIHDETEWPELNEDIREDDGYFMARIAEQLYTTLAQAVGQGAPMHQFLGERYQLRAVPDPVLREIGKHVDVFLTQALIRSPQRPPEWQVFQPDGYAREYALVQKPMIIVDWAAPFSLGASYENPNGTIRNESTATRDMQQWLQAAFQQPYIVGVFKCQFIGTHPNDRRLEGKAKRTLVRDDGSYFEHASEGMRQVHWQVLDSAYQELAR
jgi:hypothetical protein